MLNYCIYLLPTTTTATAAAVYYNQKLVVQQSKPRLHKHIATRLVYYSHNTSILTQVALWAKKYWHAFHVPSSLSRFFSLRVLCTAGQHVTTDPVTPPTPRGARGLGTRLWSAPVFQSGLG